jgi:hypothetical protein
VAEERELRDHASGDPDEPARVRRVEEALDQCWDLLRQRRGRGLPPVGVEGYRQ